jgi:hypothetical protein
MEGRCCTEMPADGLFLPCRRLPRPWTRFGAQLRVGCPHAGAGAARAQPTTDLFAAAERSLHTSDWEFCFFRLPPHIRHTNNTRERLTQAIAGSQDRGGRFFVHYPYLLMGGRSQCQWSSVAFPSMVAL